MICRLCLENIKDDNVVSLFDTNEAQTESKVLKMIAKFLQLEIAADDPISTSACVDCCKHLQEFQAFWELVEQKQRTLENEFLNVDCGDAKWVSNADPIDEFPLASELEVDEKPLDMHNLNLLGNVLDVNVDSVAIVTPFSQEHDTQEINIEHALDAASIICSNSMSLTSSELNVSSDDEVPLVKLQHKLKPKRQLRLPRLPAKLQVTTGQDEAAEVEAIVDRKPKDCTRTQLTKHYEEIIASYMEANCDLCHFSTKYFSDLKTHFLQSHQCEAYIKCCNKVFRRASKLLEHIRKHINPQLFTCSICNKTLYSQDYLKTHIETVHNKTLQSDKLLKYPCGKCERTFSSERRMNNHERKHDTDQLVHNCDTCHKSFANIHRLRRHIQSIHEDLHPHVCDICGKKFKFKPSFERHLLEHQGIVSPASQCLVCGVWLKNEHSLRLHRFTHDNKDTNCEHCGKNCVSRTSLRAHIKYAHKLQTNLQCHYCDKSFKQQRNLEEHMAIHTGLQLYNCPHCPKECRSRSNMYVHIKQRHAEEWLKAKLARSHNPQYKENL